MVLKSGWKLFRGDLRVFGVTARLQPRPILRRVSPTNSIIRVIAGNRLFVLTSPWGGLPRPGLVHAHPPASRFYGGFLRTLTSMSEIRALG